jgi:hypothetical protein
LTPAGAASDHTAESRVSTAIAAESAEYVPASLGQANPINRRPIKHPAIRQSLDNRVVFLCIFSAERTHTPNHVVTLDHRPASCKPLFADSTGGARRAAR